MASPIESPTWEREVLCGCKGCAVARKPLQDAIDRVRKLHQLDKYGECKVCIGGWDIYEDIYTYIKYPCPTIKALDGEQ